MEWRNLCTYRFPTSYGYGGNRNRIFSSFLFLHRCINVNEMSSGWERKILLRKTVIWSAIGLMASGIANGYANFYREVSQYTQSVTYREAQEARMEYNPQLMKKNQRLLSRMRAESSSGTRYT